MKKSPRGINQDPPFGLTGLGHRAGGAPVAVE